MALSGRHHLAATLLLDSGADAKARDRVKAAFIQLPDSFSFRMVGVHCTTVAFMAA